MRVKCPTVKIGYEIIRLMKKEQDDDWILLKGCFRGSLFLFSTYSVL